MWDWVESKVERARRRRGLNVFIVVLRIMIGFAFIPAGLKKVIGEPFTDPTNVGTFHEFLHGFHGTGFFYSFVGATQLLAATCLITQRFATFGALLVAPILTAIWVFCWSTWVVPTASVVTLMMLGVCALLLWDIGKWRALLGTEVRKVPEVFLKPHPDVNMTLWTRCGWLILILYFGNALVTGGVYRPMGADWSNPSFILLQVIVCLPIVTFIIDWRQYKRKTRGQAERPEP